MLGLVGLLFVVSIPWYRAPTQSPALLWGFPDWVAVALGCYVGVAVLNAVAWALTEVPDEISADREEGG